LVKIDERESRGFNAFQTVDDVIAILREQFQSRKLYMKYDVDKHEVNINEYNPDKTLMVVTDPTYKADGNLIIYGLSDKYIEIDLKIINEIGPGYFKCKIVSARRATEGRRDLRFAVQPGAAVVTNFKVSKHTIDVSKFNMPTGIKVVLEQFQSANSGLADQFKVDVLGLETKDVVLKSIKNTGKTLFVSDCSNVESYQAMTEDFIDLAGIYGSDIDRVVKSNIEKGIRSIAIVPVIYITEDQRSIPFAYIQVVSKSELFGIDKIIDLKEMSFNLVDRIRDANTLMVPVHQELIDVSRGGAKIKITDPDLIKYLKKSEGFIFDIVFKLQAPLTIYGKIKTVFQGKDGSMYVGVDFEGNSSRKDEMKRFYDVLKPMEAEYKSNLIKSLRAKKGLA